MPSWARANSKTIWQQCSTFLGPASQNIGWPIRIDKLQNVLEVDVKTDTAILLKVNHV